MAFMSQERKATLAEGLKKVIPADWKWSLSVNHHSTLVLTISQAPVDLIGENLVCQSRSEGRPTYHNLNEYHIGNEYSGKLSDTFKAIKDAMMVGNHDRSEPQSDYFDVGWYIDIKIGKFERPFTFKPKSRTKKTWSRCSMCKQATYVCAKRGCLTYAQLAAKVAELEAQAVR
jgi:hypothetical protein